MRHFAVLPLCVLPVVLFGPFHSALAQDAPRSFVTSPDVYKVIGETEHYRIMAVTWKPGQRDHWHSHSLAGVHYLTDCHLRDYRPEGESHDSWAEAGTSAVESLVQSQSLENIGQSDCRLVLLERK